MGFELVILNGYAKIMPINYVRQAQNHFGIWRGVQDHPHFGFAQLVAFVGQGIVVFRMDLHRKRPLCIQQLDEQWKLTPLLRPGGAAAD